MQRTYDIIKPNLYLSNDMIYFAIGPDDVIPASRAVDEVVRSHIGELKVSEADLEAIKHKRSTKKTESEVVSLKKYLDELEYRHPLFHPGITKASAKLFGLNYVISANTTQCYDEIINWRELQEDLVDPNKAFDSWDANHIVYRLDRQKTLEEMRKLQEKLDPNIPDNCAGFYVTKGHMQTIIDKSVNFAGAIGLLNLKAKDTTAIEQTRAELVEKLKSFEGPCLSLDTPSILEQMRRLYVDAELVVQNYGDVLLSDQRTRMFRYDP